MGVAEAVVVEWNDSNTKGCNSKCHCITSYNGKVKDRPKVTKLVIKTKKYICLRETRDMKQEQTTEEKR